jgi:ElaB/YqjD/DUF883 family membrane-anchored ribosome-binding protein
MTTQDTTYPDSKLTSERKPIAGHRTMTETVEATIPELKEQMRHMIESGKTRVSEWTGGFQEGIRAKPVQSVLIAAAVGAVVGLIIGRRSR